MDQAKTSVSSSRDGETGMEQVMSDLQALKRLYGLLHRGPADENLDETSRDLLMKMLDDATQQTLLKQAKMLSGSLMSPVLERKLSIRSDRRTRDAEPPLTLRPLVSPSPSPSILPGKRSSRLNQQYSTVSSRAGGHFDGHRQAAEVPLLARLASYRSSRTAVSALTPRHRPSGEQRNSGLSLYRLPVAATSQHGTVTGSNRHADRRDRTRQSSGRGDLSSLEGSSRRRSVSREVSLGRAWLQHGRGTGRHPGAESSSSTRRFGRLDSGLSLGMASRRGSERTGRGVAAMSRHGTVTGSNRHAGHRDRTRRTSGRGDQSSSLEGSSSRRRSVSREMSLAPARLHGRGTPRHVGQEGSSYSTRRFGRLDSGLSLGVASRRGSERTGRGVASPERSSSSNTMVTIRSRIRHRQDRDLKERCLRRAEEEAEEENTPRRRGRTNASISSAGRTSSRMPRRTLKRVDSGSMYISRSNSSSGAAISYPSTSPTASLESSASASYSPPPVSRRGIAPPLSLRGFAPAPPVSLRGIAPPVYAPRVSRSMRRRRRQEILERRVGRLRMFKNKIDMVFHHRHDHHHHLGRGLEGPSSKLIPGEHHRKSPWRHLGEMFHRTKRQDKEITSRTVVGGAPANRRGGGGNMHALFDAMRRHLRGKRRTPASVKMRRAANRSRVQAKKMHWWQRLRKRRGRKDVTAGIPRRRLGL
ncbi:hypothetical protein SEVIR_7G236400v4 [Setaria viridis]